MIEEVDLFEVVSSIIVTDIDKFYCIPLHPCNMHALINQLINNLIN